MAKPVRSDDDAYGAQSFENSPRVRAQRMPSRTEYFVQGVVHLLISAGLVACCFGILPSGAYAYFPQMVLISGVVGFLCCSACCFLGAKGTPVNSPLYRPMSIGQIAALGIWFFWFTFGNHNLPFPVRVAAGIILGFLFLVFSATTVIQIFFPAVFDGLLRGNPEMMEKYRQLNSDKSQ